MSNSRLVAALVVVTISTIVGCSDNAKQSRKAKVEEREEALQLKIADFAKRTNADSSWMTVLSQRRDTSMWLYSVDLEKLWLLGDRPIAFVGELMNVGTEDEADYRVHIRYSVFLLPELRLQILCAKERVTSVLNAIGVGKPGFSPGVAVAARIKRVEYLTEPGVDGTNTVFIGHGRCTDIAYLGDALDLILFVPRESAEQAGQ